MSELIHTTSDEALVEAITEGDREAFIELYERYFNDIYAFVVRRIGNREDAERISSDIFTQVFTNLSWFRGLSFKAWLWSISKNQLKEYWLERYQIDWYFENIIDTTTSANNEGDSEDKAHAEAVIEQLLGELPEDCRRVLQLRFLEGKTLAQTAHEMGIGKNFVKALQQRGLRNAAETRLAE